MNIEKWNKMTNEEKMDYTLYEHMWGENLCGMSRKVIDGVEYYYECGNNHAYKKVGDIAEDISTEDYNFLDAEEEHVPCADCPWCRNFCPKPSEMKSYVEEELEREAEEEENGRR